MGLQQAQTLEQKVAFFNTTSAPLSGFTTLGEVFSEASSVLPFRVSFESLGVAGYSPSNPAPIGIAVIGFNNYIL